MLADTLVSDADAPPSCAAAKVQHNTGCTVGSPTTHNTSTVASWRACCAVCGTSPSCRAWTYHAKSKSCVVGTRPGVKAVNGATCGCVGKQCTVAPPAPPPASGGMRVGCSDWTGPTWPSADPEAGTSSPGYMPATACPPTGCLFHLPSDPRELADLSSKYPQKLQQLSSRLIELRKGAFQTMNYTAGCDNCETMGQVAAGQHGFLGPLCKCEAAVIDNTKPRTDTNGQIVSAHQGGITWSKADRRYYWVGCAWVPCAEGPTGCNFTSIHNNDTWGECGFNNNNMSVYSSATLANDNWRVETMDALPRSTRAVGSYWQPNMVWNPSTSLWVLLWVFSPPNASPSATIAQAAVSKTPAGPFVMANASIATHFPTDTSAEIFVDDDGAAYIVYSSDQGSGGKTKRPVIERLTPSWTETSGEAPSAPIEPFPPPGHGSCQEGEVLFKRKGVYHLLMGSCCCFCESGTNLVLYTAPAALGPYTMQREMNPVQKDGKLALPCQQQGVSALPGANGTDVQLMWSGERWQQSPDGRKEHDPQAWVPIQFGADGSMQPLSDFPWKWSPEGGQ